LLSGIATCARIMRLGYALMLCYLRYPGRPLRINERPPAALISFVAEQIDVRPESRGGNPSIMLPAAPIAVRAWTPKNHTRALACSAIGANFFPKCELPHTSQPISLLRYGGSGRSSGECRSRQSIVLGELPCQGHDHQYTERTRLSIVRLEKPSMVQSQDRLVW
jgi:hypothetical protein